jgi:diguanylate cyclase (GGDEF)-like protein
MSEPSPSSASFNVASLAALPDALVGALETSPFGPFAVHPCATRDDVLRCMSDERGCDALIVGGPTGVGDEAEAIAAGAAPDLALIVVARDVEPATMLYWLQAGAQDVLLQEHLADASFASRLRAAIERKRLERESRTAYATDLETGLPHQQQLIEHMSQLMALREREPAPMAVLALRIEGLATTQARLGREASNVLRRKLGVRLRAGVRASDVVASLGDDSFAVLLGSILTPADAERVGAKLLKALMEPLRVAGQEVAVATAIGIGHYPQDGAQPEALLRRAVSLAAAAPAEGRAGFANFAEAGAQGAANDD